MAEEEKNQAGAGDEVASDPAEPAAPSEPEPAGNAGEAEASGGVVPEAEESQAGASDEVAEDAAGDPEAEETQAGASDEVAEDPAEPAAPSEPEPAQGAEGDRSSGEAGRGGEAEASGGDVVPDPGPKARRRLKRSRASGPPRPARTPEERAMERAEEHGASGERRRRYRAARRRKRGEPGTGTPPAPREPGKKKVRQGTVVSAGGDKTITVEIAVVRRHPTYEKVVRRTSKLRAHDEANQAQEGDVVRIVESRPLSRTKRWRLLEILEKAR
jgi:small subunit ribosomal protein S17